MNFKFFKGQLPNYDRQNTVWKTTTGRQTPITWLTNNHIINILDCLNGIGSTEIPEIYLGKTKQEWISIFTTELRIRHVENPQTV
jgi:hypothetical protein